MGVKDYHLRKKEPLPCCDTELSPDGYVLLWDASIVMA